jgi:hypothetical protein
MSIEQFIQFYLRVQRQMEAKDPEHYWREALDHPILAACRERPDHLDVCEVNAKVALVNRMYGANLGGGGRNYKAEWRIAEALVRKKADTLLTPLRGLPGFTAAVPAVVRCHVGLVALVRQAAGRDEESFCSKYASFHAPEVAPILDSVAEENARRLTSATFDPEGEGRYERHCRRLLYLLDVLRANSVACPGLKLLDHVLYGMSKF